MKRAHFLFLRGGWLSFLSVFSFLLGTLLGGSLIGCHSSDSSDYSDGSQKRAEDREERGALVEQERADQRRFKITINKETKSKEIKNKNKDTQNTSRRPLVLWHSYRGVERVLLDQTLVDFQKKTGRSVRVLHLPYAAFTNKLQIAIPRGNGPDVFIFAHDRVGDWAESGLIEPIGFWMSRAMQSRFFPSALRALTYKDQLYGLPLSCKTLALFYHKELVPSIPQTTDELIQIAQHSMNLAHQDTSEDAPEARGAQKSKVWGLAYPELDSLYFHAPWLHGFGGHILSVTHQPLINQEAIVESIRYIRRLRDDLKLIPPEVNGALTSELFRSKRLAFVINGPWFKGDLIDAKDQISDTRMKRDKRERRWWGVAPLPVLSETGRPLAPFVGVEGVMISSRSQDLKGAWILSRFLTSDQQSRARLREGQLVANRSPYTETETEGELSQDTWIKTFNAQLKVAVVLSNAPEMKMIWTPMKRALSQSILYGEDIEYALKEAEIALQSIKQKQAED